MGGERKSIGDVVRACLLGICLGYGMEERYVVQRICRGR